MKKRSNRKERKGRRVINNYRKKDEASCKKRGRGREREREREKIRETSRDDDSLQKR